MTGSSVNFIKQEIKELQAKGGDLYQHFADRHGVSRVRAKNFLFPFMYSTDNINDVANRESPVVIDLIVTRHAGLLQYLKEIGLANDSTAVISHATPELVAEKNVCGVLPHYLSSLCKTYTEIPLDLPENLRGVELTVDQLRQYVSGPPVTYTVKPIITTRY